MTIAEQQQTESAWPPSARRVALGGGAVGLFLLMVSANFPLEGGPAIPRGSVLFLTACVVPALGLFLHEGRADERLASAVLAGAMIRILAIDGLLRAEVPVEVCSRLSGALSTTHGGIPLLGLFLAWTVLAAGFITTRALSRLATTEGANGAGYRASSFAMGILVLLFGMRALIGYVTGSTHLFAQA